MTRFVRLLPLVMVGSVLVGQSHGQDTAGWISELRELRKTVELQSKQIEALSQQIARLNAHLEGKPAPAPAPVPGPANSGAVPASPPAAPAANSEEFAPNAPAPAEAGPPKHVVMKGETLTSIAKHYNITLQDLQKANKDINDRKLQIGQTINLPPNAQAKNPEPTTTDKGQP